MEEAPSTLPPGTYLIHKRSIAAIALHCDDTAHFRPWLLSSTLALGSFSVRTGLKIFASLRTWRRRLSGLRWLSWSWTCSCSWGWWWTAAGAGPGSGGGWWPSCRGRQTASSRWTILSLKVFRWRSTVGRIQRRRYTLAHTTHTFWRKYLFVCSG